MTDWPQLTRADHDQFCRAEGWRLVRNARGRTGTHHITYELDLPTSGTLRTRVSHPPDRTDYGRNLWSHILRDQLHITEADFWACVRDGVLPNRGAPPPVAESLPAELVYLLITRVGLTEEEVRELSKDEAVARLTAHWTGDEHE